MNCCLLRKNLMPISILHLLSDYILLLVKLYSSPWFKISILVLVLANVLLLISSISTNIIRLISNWILKTGIVGFITVLDPFRLDTILPT